MKKAIILSLALALAGCASTAMNRFTGKSINEAFFSYGRPENVFDLPDGRRAFQFYWGGSSFVVPATSTTALNANGLGGYTATTTSVPGGVLESKGCLVTLIARPNGTDFFVEEYRIPKRLVC
jgi:hypothetical protein